MKRIKSSLNICAVLLVTVLPTIIGVSASAASAAIGQETSEAGAVSFSIESGVLSAPLVSAEEQGVFAVQLTLSTNSRFKLTQAAPVVAPIGGIDSTFQASTGLLILPRVAVLQGGEEIARYELLLKLEDAESLIFSIDKLTELEIDATKGLQEVCKDYGCFELQTKLSEMNDGVIDPNLGRSARKVYWDRSELASVPIKSRMPTLSNIEKVGHAASPSAVVVIGDWCMNQTTGSSSQDPVFHATAPASGFFVSDSLVLTTSKALRTIEGDARDGIALDGGLIRMPPIYDGEGGCARYSAQLASNGGNYKLESGAGPVVQLFDGRWGLGEVVWSDEVSGLGALRLVAVTQDRTLPIASWEPWQGKNSNMHWLNLQASDVLDSVGETATVHHPGLARSEGGWFVSPSSALNCSVNGDSDLLYLNHYSDGSSNGAPIIDASGVVVAIVGAQKNDNAAPFLCADNQPRTTTNTLGPLSRYYADSFVVTIGSPVSAALIEALKAIEPSVNELAASASTELPVRPAVSLENFQRFEVPIMGDEFTESGFPVAQLNTTAIDIAKQATVAFIRESGCPECDQNRLDLNFNVPCICTGFAVSDTLIVTNDHCVTYLSIGSKTTFRTFFGQDVEAELVGKTSLDGETRMSERYYEIYQGLAAEGDLTGVHRGDVALLRTTQKMLLEPLKIADSSTLEPWDPLITVGHPERMSRTGPWVTGVGSFLGLDYFTRTNQAYNLPAQSGASGSAVVNLAGELVGQIAYGGLASDIEAVTVLPKKYSLFAVDLEIDRLETPPAPYTQHVGIPISQQVSTGAPSNYIKEMIEKWAPGELL